MTCFDELTVPAPIVGQPETVRAVSLEKRLLVAVLVVEACVAVPRLAHGQFLSVFDSIFSSIQSDMGSSLKAINQIKQQVSSSIRRRCGRWRRSTKRADSSRTRSTPIATPMNQIFTTKFSSAVLPGPQQFETLLHSRLSTQIPSLQTSFTTNYGAVPQVKRLRRRTA